MNLKRPLEVAQASSLQMGRMQAGSLRYFSRFLATFLFCVAALFDVSVAVASETKARLYECQIEPKPGENFSYAAVQCWVPASLTEIKGVLCIILHPLDNGGALLKEPNPWIELAARHDHALVAVAFVESRDKTKHWHTANQGSGRALLAALDELAGETGLPAFRYAPATIGGVCAAGQFAYEFAAFAPARTKAFFTIGGGMHDVAHAAEASGASGVLIGTPDRGDWAVENILSLFSEGRKYGAPWAFALETIETYDTGGCSLLVGQFLEGLMSSQSQDAAGIRDNRGIILPLSDLKAPRDTDTEAVASFIAQLSQTELTCSFSNEATGQAWKASDQRSAYPALSFLGRPLPQLGSVEPNINLGRTILADDGTGEVTAEVNVSCEPGVADSIAIVADKTRTRSDIEPVGPGKWHAQCRVNLTPLPIGAYNIELPIRFLKDGKCILGGISAFLTGTIAGDIQVEPKAMGVGSVAPGKAHSGTIRLTSRSGTPIEILEIKSDTPNWIAPKVESTDGSAVTLRFDMEPTMEMAGRTFSGYLTMRVKSKYEQTIKLLCYGTVTPE
jgi:hypothetical protein